jgi:hypothetical protein
MTNSQGWIMLYRQFLEWEWYNDTNTKVLFIHLILKANHKDNRYKGRLIKRGTLLTGRSMLSKEVGLSEQQVRTSLSKLKSTNEITIESTKQGTVIMIVNYDKYQSATNEVTTEQPTSNQRVTTNNNDNKEKNEKKDNNISTFLEWFNVQKEVHTGKKGAFKTLSTTDVNNLKQLKRVYEETDFDVAFVGMASNPWVKENGAMNPAHFLRVDNFNRYLDSGVKRLPALSRIAAHTAVQSGGSILQGYIDKGYTIEEIQNYAK